MSLFNIVEGLAFDLINLPSLDLLGAVQIIAPKLPADLLDDHWVVSWVTQCCYSGRLSGEELGGEELGAGRLERAQNLHSCGDERW
jgi:hypothetical protein